MINADAIRTLYAYHFALNRRLWDDCVVKLGDAGFVRDLDYSLGAIRNQVIHLINVDESWFARLQGVDVPSVPDPHDFPDLNAVAEKWREVEAMMQTYLDALEDAQLAQVVHYDRKRQGPTSSPAWQILVHVVNHATDHRAQILAGLYRLGAPTIEQGLISYLWEQE